MQSEREGLPEAEQVKRDRRLIRAIKSGRSVTDLSRAFGIPETRIRKFADANGLTIARGAGGNRL